MLPGGRDATAGCLRSPFASPFTSPIATADAGESISVDGAPIQELEVGRISEPVPFTGPVTVLRQPESLEVGMLGVTLRNEGTEPCARTDTARERKPWTPRSSRPGPRQGLCRRWPSGRS